MGVAHRDLKPENLLVTADGCLKITDFGNSECFRMAWESEKTNVLPSKGVCGSEPYIAPEEFENKEFDPRLVDVWSIGIIYLTMTLGRFMWKVAKAGEDPNFDDYLVTRKKMRQREAGGAPAADSDKTRKSSNGVDIIEKLDAVCLVCTHISWLFPIYQLYVIPLILCISSLYPRSHLIGCPTPPVQNFGSGSVPSPENE